MPEKKLRLTDYKDLSKENTFRYFVCRNNQINIYMDDQKYLPSQLLREKEKEVVILDFEKYHSSLKNLIRELLTGNRVNVEEYLEVEEEESCKEIVRINNQNFRLARFGSYVNFQDFSDLCIDSQIAPTICMIEQKNEGKIEFSVLKETTIHRTCYSDDDLLSNTYVLLQQHNSIECLIIDKNLRKHLSSWGVDTVFYNNNSGIYNHPLSSYFKTDFPIKDFVYQQHCQVFFEDFLENFSTFTLQTQQGKRLLKTWMRTPLTDYEEIERRRKIGEAMASVQVDLTGILDFQRFFNKIDSQRISKEEIVTLGLAIVTIENTVLKGLRGCSNTFVQEDLNEPLNKVISMLTNFLDSAYRAIDFSTSTVRESSTQMTQLACDKKQIKERSVVEAERIKRIFPKAKIDGFTCKTTLLDFSNGDCEKFPVLSRGRSFISFTSKELHRLRNEQAQLEKQIQIEESAILQPVRKMLKESLESLAMLNFLVALCDVYRAFSYKTLSPRFSKPSLQPSHTTHQEFQIVDAWNPLVNDCVCNSISLCRSHNLCVVTGPNMGGKSTFLRTLATVALFAQIGCYVPCYSPSVLPVFSRIVVRAGARDSISMNSSTFMLEMKDLLRVFSFTQDGPSLVLIDELGRGTSEIDGLSLCLGLKEYLAEMPLCISVISTHYHRMASPYAKESQISSQGICGICQNNKGRICYKCIQINDNNFITHKVVDGFVDKSYGLNVAKMVKFPPSVIEEAKKYIK